METAEILSRMERLNGQFEREAVESALEVREEIIPALLFTLERLADYPADVARDREYMAHLYAMYLLAQFRETRAFPVLIRIASLPEDQLEDLLGDHVTESLPKLLASVWDGDQEPIRALIENENASVWARVGGLDCLVTLAIVGKIRRENVLGYFAELFRFRLAREARNETIFSGLVAAAVDLHPEDLIDDIQKAYADELIDTTMITLDDVKEEMARGKDAALARLRKDPHHQLVSDAVREMSGWYCFHRDDKMRRDDPIDWQPQPASADWETATLPFRRTAPKVGRNEPCPCGSGKKYKKCCL